MQMWNVVGGGMVNGRQKDGKYNVIMRVPEANLSRVFDRFYMCILTN